MNDRELLAQMMIRQSLATGHGDTVADLVRELEPQIERLRAEVAQWKADHDIHLEAANRWSERAVAAEAERDRLRELLRDVAASGVEYEATNYFVIQIDKSTWLDVIAALGGEKK